MQLDATFAITLVATFSIILGATFAIIGYVRARSRARASARDDAFRRALCEAAHSAFTAYDHDTNVIAKRLIKNRECEASHDKYVRAAPWYAEKTE